MTTSVDTVEAAKSANEILYAVTMKATEIMGEQTTKEAFKVVYTAKYRERYFAGLNHYHLTKAWESIRANAVAVDILHTALTAWLLKYAGHHEYLLSAAASAVGYEYGVGESTTACDDAFIHMNASKEEALSILRMNQWYLFLFYAMQGEYYMEPQVK